MAILASSLKQMQAQTIFTFGGKSVSKEEFMRMYTKNSVSRKVDLSAKAINEYVTLYSRFKMKVAEAEALRIDTLPNISTELESYKKQLSKSYLTDKDMVENLCKEAHEKLKKDVNAAHILIAIPKGVIDTMSYFKQADSLYKAIQAGASFEELAKNVSADKATGANGGALGFFTALQTPYEFEAAAYSTAIGKVSKPVRTTFGYHIIKKIAERPAKGELSVAQIMIAVRKSYTPEQTAAAKKKADSIYLQLKGNAKATWNDYVVAYSDDKYSVSNGGELQPFGVNNMAPDFEEAAFKLQKPGDISQPVLTEYGYHIIKLINKITVKPYDSMKTEMKRKIEKDGRIDMAKTVFLNKLKAKGNFKEMPENLKMFIKNIPDTAIKNGYLVDQKDLGNNMPLFILKNINYDSKAFIKNMMASNRGRIFGDKVSALNANYQAFVEKVLMDVEENNLAVENVEFKNLIKEYRDGIMLFDLTDKSVWTKASTDSNGLAKFYENNKSKYQWSKGFVGKNLRTNNEKDAKELFALLQNNSIDSAVAKMNVSEYKVNIEEAHFEYEKLDPSVEKVAVKAFSNIIKSKEGPCAIYVPTTIYLQPTQKSLADSRGYAIADYQDFLEKQWIANMEAKYPVKVNTAVVKSCIK